MVSLKFLFFLHFFGLTSTILEQELQELQKSSFLFAEMGLGQAEQHLSWPTVYTLFFYLSGAGSCMCTCVRRVKV